MIFLKLAAPLAVIFVSHFALAEAEPKPEMKVNVIERTVVRDSSEHNRMDIKNSVLVQLVGAGPAAGSSSGVILGHYFDSDRLIQLSILNAKTNWSYEGTWGSRTDASGYNIGLAYKQFNGNSFYYRGGVDYSTVDYRYDFISYLGSFDNSGYSFKGNKISASVAVGNQWQWENFTVGCDWIGWSIPVSHSSSDEKSYGNNPYSSRDLQQYKETYLQNGYPLALHFYMGASF